MKKTPLNKLDLDLYEETLDNGLRIFIIPKSDVNNVYVTYSTKYGSIHNEFIPIGEKEMVKVPDGVAHFLEHKVFAQKDGVDPFYFYSKSGSDCNANTSNHKTTYLFVGQQNIEENLNYLLDFVGEPYFTEENVEKEKGIIEQELKMYQDNPDTNSIEKIIYNSFVNHPIKISVGGTVESIYKITKEDLYTCYNTFYHPSNMFICITGNVDPKVMIKVIKDNMSKKKFDKAKKIILKEIDEPDRVAKEKETIKMNITIPRVLISYKFNIENTNLDQRTISNFINMYASIKIGPVSILNEELKNKGIIHDDLSFTTLKTDKHILLIIDAETDKKEELINLIDKEIKTNKTLEKEFNREKKVAIASCIYSSDSIYSINGFIMSSIITEDKVNYNIYDYYKKLSYKEFDKLIKKLKYDNKSILFVNSK